MLPFARVSVLTAPGCTPLALSTPGPPHPIANNLGEHRDREQTTNQAPTLCAAFAVTSGATPAVGTRSKGLPPGRRVPARWPA